MSPRVGAPLGFVVASLVLLIVYGAYLWFFDRDTFTRRFRGRRSRAQVGGGVGLVLVGLSVALFDHGPTNDLEARSLLAWVLPALVTLAWLSWGSWMIVRWLREHGAREWTDGLESQVAGSHMPLPPRGGPRTILVGGMVALFVIAAIGYSVLIERIRF